MSTNYVPAIKAKMGDWTYYITKMKFGEVEKQVELAETLHPSKELDEAIQRELTNRVTAMTEFLLSEPQRFYGSLVVAIYKGNPMFHPIKIDEKHGIVDQINHSFGLLQMDGSQTYFALDGQHRLESIKSACKENPDLRSEEISVIVIKHEESKSGLIRTRRLFTKLNRYAKATDTKTNITIDEDDCIAITTRRLIREMPELKGLIKVDASGKQISTRSADGKYLTTMAGLYEMNLNIGRAFQNGTELNKEFLSRRPNDQFLEDMYLFLEGVIKELLSGIDTYKRITQNGETPGTFRKRDGGDIWVRPIFQLIASEVIQRGILANIPVTKIVSKLNAIPKKLDQEPWVNILWNPGTNRISGARAERSFYVEAIVHSIGCGKSNHTKKEINKFYGKYYNRDSKEFPKLT